MAPPADVRRALLHHLAALDTVLKGRVEWVYLVGSVALDAYQPGRSDVDLVIVLDRRLTSFELWRLRLGRVLGAVPRAAANVVRRRWTFPGTVNAVYVTTEDVTRPVSAIEPVASHAGTSFSVGSAFDVNPVSWSVLARRGVPVIGPPPAELGLDPEPDTLVPWCRDNLATFWRGLATRRRGGRISRSGLAQEVLNVPRLWVTATTGEVVSRVEAGERALAAFGPEWHPLLRDALAWRHHQPADPAFADPHVRAERTAAWIDHVCDTVLGGQEAPSTSA